MRTRAYLLVVGFLLFVPKFLWAYDGLDLCLSLTSVLEDAQSYKPGYVLVRFVEPLTPVAGDEPWTGPRTQSSIRAIIAERIIPGAVIVRDLGTAVPGLVSIRLPCGVSVQDAVAAFNRSPYVVYAEPNYKLRLAYFPRDAWFDSQWALHNTGQSIRVPGQPGQFLPPGLAGADINAPEGWDIMGKGKEGDAGKVFVAVLDTGVDFNHPDLQPNLWSETLSLVPSDANLADPNFNPNDPNYLYTSYGADFVDDPPEDVMDPQGNPYSYDPNVMDTHYHGTAVAGIIGATWENSGIAGVCKTVKIVTVRITDGNEINMDTAVAGFGFALSFGYNAPKNKAHIVNCSWGTQSWPQSLYSAIARAPEVLVVAAAGNMFDDPNVPAGDMDAAPFYPAGFGSALGAGRRGADPLPNVISVMATDRFDQRASYSNWGPRTVHIGAPGDAIITLVPVLGTPALTADGIPAIVGTQQSEGVGLVSGTSYAAPHVTGAAALALAINPSLPPVRIRYLITHPDAVDPVLPELCTSGGRLNLAKFLRLVPAGKVRNLRTGKEYSGLTPITDAIKEAANGDELVADANRFYAEPTINFNGKLIKLRSGILRPGTVGPPSPQDTIIAWYDERQARSGQVMVPDQPTVLFASNETEKAVLEGFTVQDGAPGIQIGQVVIQNKKEVLRTASPRVVNCIVKKNKVKGGIICLGGSASIEDCKVNDNIAQTTGGGIHVARGATIQITDCDVAKNVATDSWGGGICLDGGSAQIKTTRVRTNQARWYGGGIYLYESRSTIVDCNVTGNYSFVDGGGIYWEGAGAPISLSNTIITANRAFYGGGGIGCMGTAGQIKNCLITDNVSEGTDGGGMHLRSSKIQIGNCTFARNHCLPIRAYGGAVYQEEAAVAEIRNSIFYDNNDVAIAHGDNGSASSISYCLFYANAQGDFRRAGRQYLVSDPVIKLVVPGNNNIVADPRFVRGRLGDYYLSNWDAGQILDIQGRPIDPEITPGSQPSDANSPAIDAGSDLASTLGLDQYSTRTDNVKDTGIVDIGFHYNDPEENRSYFVVPIVTPAGKAQVEPGPDFFKEFSQVLIKVTVTDTSYQLKGWTGTDNDAKLDLDSNGFVMPKQWNIVTIRRPSEQDYIPIGIGLETVHVELRARVTGQTEAGTVTPTRMMVRRGSTVPVSVVLKDKNYIVRWTGTDDDLSAEFTNTVTMRPPYSTDPRGRDYKEVVAYLYRPKTIIIGPDGIDYGIVDGASEGDVVIIPSGTHTASPPVQTIVVDKGITISGQNPDSPDATGATVLKNYQIIINNSHVVLEGLTFTDLSKIYIVGCSPTIRNCRFINCYKWGGDGVNTTQEPDDGPNGGSAVGGAIEITGLGNTAPKIQNCIFSGCFVRGGNGADGDDNPTGPGFDGGWQGYAYGGAVYASGDADILFQDCDFENCYAMGGSGGDGGDGGPGQHGGRGGGWVWPPSYETGPGTTNPYIDWSWWDGWLYGPYSDYWKYSGYGGAACLESGSRARFISCNFNNNRTIGGLSGLGSAVSVEDGRPERRLRINNFGGAVYADEGCTLEFIDCNLAYNDANIAIEPGASFAGPNEPHDIYVSMGGSIAVEDNCLLKMSNCRLYGSRATMGGAIYARNAQVILDQVYLDRHNAYLGGAVLTTNCTGSINTARFADNRAEFVLELVPSAADANILVPVFDPGIILAQGGGFYAESSSIAISHSVFTNNFAQASGGGLYFSAVDRAGEEAMYWLRNCLLTGNVANRDGGGISASWYAKLKVSNCTIVENKATGSFGNGSGLGGGIYAGYASDVEVVDSILWKNIGPDGAQVAVSNGSEYGARPSRLTMRHSLVGPQYDPTAFATLGLATASLVPTGPTGKLVEAQSIYSQFDAGQRTVDVLVCLQDDPGLRELTRWGDPAAETRLREEMARRQQQVISKLSPADLKIKYTYQNIPAFSAAVTRGGLARLLVDNMVASIEPVRTKCLQLRQALSLGNAMEIRQEYGGSGIGIAIVDTGVDYRHPMLGRGGFPNAKVVGGYDTGDNDPDPLPSGAVPDSAHGTCCAGIAAGNLGQWMDYVGGVAPGARIYALKAARDATPTVLFDDAILAAWDWCITHRNDNLSFPIKVINNSFGSGSYSSRAAADAAYPTYARMAKACVDAGITIVAAAGNNGVIGGLSVPAAISNVVAVGAVYDTTDQVPAYSNSATYLDILAPGDPIYTTDIVGARGYTNNDYFGSFTGTSSACPFVAGAVACLQSAAWQRLRRYLTPAEVRAVLQYTGDPVIDTKTGITTPRINLAAAITGPWGPPIRIEKGCEVNRFTAVTSKNYGTWDPAWDPNSGNIVADPLFVEGYYLSSRSAGQQFDSPCIDAGSLHVSDPNVRLADYTTSTAGTKDTGLVDIGYHYAKGLTAFRLTATVVPSHDGLPHGTVQPESAVVYEGRGSNVIVVKARPDAGYKVKKWTGTDDDASTALVNRVTVDRDRSVTVEFEQASAYQFAVKVMPSKDGLIHGRVEAAVLDPDGEPNALDISKPVMLYDGTVIRLTAVPDAKYELTGWSGTDDDTSKVLVNTATIKSKNLTVSVYFEAKVVRTLSVPGQYPTIQKAIEAAKDGDTIVVDPGTYYGGESAYSSFILTIDKAVTISSRNPEDPCCVASTVIDGYATMNEWRNLGVIFGPNAGRETVLNGFTIQNCGGVAADGDDGDRDANHPDGYDGSPLYGAGIMISTGAKPVIKNCVIRNNIVQGGNGGDGENATTTQNAGRGGWGGYAWGAGVYIMPSDPANGLITSPLFINCRFEGNRAIGGNGGNGGNGVDGGGLPNYGGNYTPASRLYIDPNSTAYTQTVEDLWQIWGYIGDYRWYSGYGGAVFCDKDSQAQFIGCVFRDNHVVGGMSGIGGQQPPENRNIEPLIAFGVPSYGGAVYCASQSQVRFERCTFENNTSSQTPEGTDPNHTLDPYLGHGGNVAAELGAKVEFIDCNILSGFAHTGGGIYVADAYVRIADSNLMSNTAIRGGGLFGRGGQIKVEDCNVAFNVASAQVADANLGGESLGAGGGMMFVECSPSVRHTKLSGNVTSGTGGAIYFRGQGEPTIFNCLFTYNGAARHGGAISAGWMTNITIRNCTFVGNAAVEPTGLPTDAGYGGAIYCSNEGVVTVLDSILWDNLARKGAQVAVRSGLELDRRCGRVTIDYSDISVGPNDLYADKGCAIQLHKGVITKPPLFVSGPQGPYYLSQTAAGQAQDSPAVDAGSNLSGVVGLSSFTTATNDRPDIRLVDMGYHYPILQPCKLCDVVFDGLIDMHDYAAMANQWLKGDCGQQNSWCNGADVTFDGVVDKLDLAKLADCWLAADDLPPMPDPPQWLTRPARVGLFNTVQMEAKRATDAWGWDVEYLFDCLTGPGHDGDWQRSPVYLDSLALNAGATYRFKVRDELGNETGWSEAVYVGPATGTCMAPSGPLSLSTVLVDPCSITVMGTRLNDPDGVRYYFDIDATDVNDSGWIDIDPNYGANAGPAYRFAGLRPNTVYRIRYKARDLGNALCPQMETAWSEWLVVRTTSAADLVPPEPNPMQWDTADDPNGPAGRGGAPFELYVPERFGWAARMTAVQANDASGYVEYFFDCVSSVSSWDKGFDSGWITDRTYQVFIGNRPSMFNISFRVKARDAFGNETGWSSLQRVVPPAGQ